MLDRGRKRNTIIREKVGIVEVSKIYREIDLVGIGLSKEEKRYRYKKANDRVGIRGGRPKSRWKDCLVHDHLKKIYRREVRRCRR